MEELYIIYLVTFLGMSYSFIILHSHGFKTSLSSRQEDIEGRNMYGDRVVFRNEWQKYWYRHDEKFIFTILLAPISIFIITAKLIIKHGNPFHYCVHSSWFVNGIYFSPLILLSTLWLM